MEPGTKLGPYEITEQLGAGGMGEVYLAQDTRLGRKVAIKVLPAEFASDPERLARFEQEARAAAALNHPHIAVVHDIGTEDGTHFMVQEYLEGDTLREPLGKGALPIKKALGLATEIAEALAAAHTAGISHRDLKPENIFVTKEGHAKVLDFGIAKLREGLSEETQAATDLTQAGQTLGTVPYMSPEQVLGESLDARSDLFSLGVVLYESATGSRPFAGNTSAAVFDAILHATPARAEELNARVPPELGQAIARLLDKDPEARFQSATEVTSFLESIGRDKESAVLNGVTDSGLRRWSSPILAGVATASLVLLAWIAWSFVVGSPTATDMAPLRITPLTSRQGLSYSASWSPDGSQLAFDDTSNGSLDVAVMSLGGGDPRFVAQGPLDEHMPRWSPDGSKIAFVADDGSGMDIYWVPPTGGPRRTIARTNFLHLDRASVTRAIGSQPWSPDGRKLVFSRLEPAGNAALWQIDLESGVETQLTVPASGTEDWDAAWSRDGDWIAFSRTVGAAAGLYRIPADGGDPQVVLVDEHDNRVPSWTPEDRRLVFVSRRAGGRDLFDVEVGGGPVRPLTNGVRVTNPVVSANGRIAFSNFSHETYFYRMRVGSSDEHEQISLSGGNNFSQRFSPDGQTIVFQSSRGGRSEIWLHDVQGGQERRLTNPPAGAEDRTPNWSPDGTQVVFLSNRDGPFQLWMTNVDGAPRRLVDQAIPMDGDWWVSARAAPRWSSDGMAIAYLAPHDQRSTLWLTNPDGTNVRPSNVSDVLRFDWYMDSNRVVHTRRRRDGTGGIEMLATNLSTGEEQLLLEANTTELSVAPDGKSVAYNSADGHMSFNRYVLRLAPPETTTGLPRPVGLPEQITFGNGVWHVHGGAWSPDSSVIVYTQDFDRGDIYVIDNYRD